jgi:hypothetical protein
MMPPIEALRAWTLLFVDYIATKQIIASALNSIVEAPQNCSKVPMLRFGERLMYW